MKMHKKGLFAVMALGALLSGGVAMHAADVERAKLPFTVYAEAGDMPWIPSGYMGNTSAIKMSDDSTDNPHSGKTALKVEYTASDNWGGVVWQSPANDWDGNQPGGFDLTGAKKLTFWARGAKGGEAVDFSFGLCQKGKYTDTAKGELKGEKLTKEWKQYSIDLTGKNLSVIKTGFCWVLGAKGEPITFYLDVVRYE